MSRRFREFKKWVHKSKSEWFPYGPKYKPTLRKYKSLKRFEERMQKKWKRQNLQI